MARLPLELNRLSYWDKREQVINWLIRRRRSADEPKRDIKVGEKFRGVSSHQSRPLSISEPATKFRPTPLVDSQRITESNRV